MNAEKPRISRLTSIITQLQSKSIVTATELAKKYQVSTRTIYRDIKTIENSGIPIYVEEGKGYSLMPDYSLPPVRFTKEEALALITAEEIINTNNDQSLVEKYQSAIEKIKATLKSGTKADSELLSKRIYIRKNQENENQSNNLIKIQSAIADCKLCDITYLSLDNANTQRTIEPFAVYSTNNKWILIAYCRLRNEFRSFRLDCIQKINVLKDNFSAHNMTLEQYYYRYLKNDYTPDKPLSQP
jgi:predicted DNA-binding transcriptional regulator YafY